MDSYWLAEVPYNESAWYAKSIERLTVIGTTNAWEARRFATRDDCLDWIDSWSVPEIEKRKYAPVSHGFVHENK